MGYKSYILIHLFLLITAAQDCEPLFWEVDPTFSVSANEIESYVKQEKLEVPNQSELFTIYNYSISNIKTTMVYDDKNKVITIQDNSVTVTGIYIDLFFTFDALQKVNTVGTVIYSGKGTANLTRVSINYTKDLVVENGNAIFILDSADVLVPNNVVLGKLVPTPSKEVEINHFAKVANVRMYKDVQNAIDLNMITYLNAYLATQSIQNLFGGDQFNYQYNSYDILLDTHISRLSLNRLQGGRIAGYKATLVLDSNPPCGTFVPTSNLKATYITKQLVDEIWGKYIFNPTWQSLILDNTNAKSDLFQFYTVDLEDIIPQALVDFPRLLSKLNAKCALNTEANPTVNIDIGYGGFTTTLDWWCGVFHTQTQTNLLNFKSNIAFKSKLSVTKQGIKVIVGQAAVSKVEWGPVDNYPLLNQNLAYIYLVSIVNSLSGTETIGTGFKQPNNPNPKVTIDSKLITIIDTTK